MSSNLFPTAFINLTLAINIRYNFVASGSNIETIAYKIENRISLPANCAFNYFDMLKLFQEREWIHNLIITLRANIIGDELRFNLLDACKTIISTAQTWIGQKNKNVNEELQLFQLISIHQLLATPETLQLCRGKI